MAYNHSTALSWLYANIIPFYPASISPPSPSATPSPTSTPTPSTTSSPPSPTFTSPSSTSASARSPSPPPPPSSPPSPPPSPLLHPVPRPPPPPPSSAPFSNSSTTPTPHSSSTSTPITSTASAPRSPSTSPSSRTTFNFRNDFTAGVRYCSLFDVIVDVIISVLVITGYETVPMVVTEIGWPNASSAANEFETNVGYAKICLRGLVKHLKFGMGTSLLREVSVYEMFDRDEGSGSARQGFESAFGTAFYN
ncbi:hypothetical protein Fmac_014050 [Flemingia macrophylla]|uniref:glucan endo-1,3-beta-D-glucosidase n=1 Tax=Flemingia macrophylla TaxID=520843 RepID=A0ABD1MB54_9FABA